MAIWVALVDRSAGGREWRVIAMDPLDQRVEGPGALAVKRSDDFAD